MSDPAAAQPAIPDSALPPNADPGYAQQMIDRADGKQPDAPPPADAPSGDKPVDWEKRYKDLQAEYTRVKQGKPAETPAEPPKDGEQAKAPDAPTEPPPVESNPDAAQAKSVTDKAGIDWAEANEHFAKNGTLSDDHFAKLEAIGIPRQMAEQYVEGQKALNQSRRADILSSVGGEDAYREVTTWAAQNLTPDEIKAFNSIVTGSDVGAAKIAISGLHARFSVANGGVEPKLISGDNAPPSSGGFRSTAEMKQAMNDPRYKTDPAYREEVARRVAASSIL